MKKKLNFVSKDCVERKLKNVNHNLDKLYRSNTLKVLTLENISSITSAVNEQIKQIIDSLPDGLYTIKYCIYGNDITILNQPTRLFYSKANLKKHVNIKPKNYPYSTFGIRLELIESSSERYIYIIIV